MPELIVDILAGLLSLAMLLLWYFYLFPRMKQEYKTRGWSRKHHYKVCDDDDRVSYCTVVRKNSKKERRDVRDEIKKGWDVGSPRI